MVLQLWLTSVEQLAYFYCHPEVNEFLFTVDRVPFNTKSKFLNYLCFRFN
jgi:hypothetical protein